MMEWSKLLCAERLVATKKADGNPYRTPFEIDRNRLVFSEAWRVLGGKTQVHGATGTSFVRTRLTHSLEVSHIARSIGAIVGQSIAERKFDGNPLVARDIANILEAAGLWHDLASMPFGHTGEDAVSEWFDTEGRRLGLFDMLNPQVVCEMVNFEANAQSFRTVSRLEGWKSTGGLQLTCATLAAAVKYPHLIDTTLDQPAGAKYSFYRSEADLFREVAEKTGLIEYEPGKWVRHPLAYLLEAADDIAYTVCDIEDGAHMRCISLTEAEEMLAALAGPLADEADFDGAESERRLIRLRSLAIERQIQEVADAFLELEPEIMAGKRFKSLMKEIPAAPVIKRVLDASADRIYRNRKRLEFDMVGWKSLHILLGSFCPAFLERERKGQGGRLSARSLAVVRLFPEHEKVPYDREGWLRRVMDYIASRTDEDVIRLAKIFEGI